jgi:hypothetical protein
MSSKQSGAGDLLGYLLIRLNHEARASLLLDMSSKQSGAGDLLGYLLIRLNHETRASLLLDMSSKQSGAGDLLGYLLIRLNHFVKSVVLRQPIVYVEQRVPTYGPRTFCGWPVRLSIESK